MDRHSPPFYIEDTDHGCQEMEDFVQHVLGMTAVGRAHLHACVDENGIIVSRPYILSVLEGVCVYVPKALARRIFWIEWTHRWCFPSSLPDLCQHARN